MKFKLAQAIVRKIIIPTVGPPSLYLKLFLKSRIMWFFCDDPLNFVKFKLARAIVRKIIILTVGPPSLYL